MEVIARGTHNLWERSSSAGERVFLYGHGLRVFSADHVWEPVPSKDGDRVHVLSCGRTFLKTPLGWRNFTDLALGPRARSSVVDGGTLSWRRDGDDGIYFLVTDGNRRVQVVAIVDGVTVGAAGGAVTAGAKLVRKRF